VIELLRPVQHRVHTITADNGKEFAGHETIATDPSGPSGCRTSRRTGLEAGFYFAHPYSSWERGLNPADGGGTENTDGLIRQYFPKSRDFTTITESDTQAVMDKLNNRPRKCLGFSRPEPEASLWERAPFRGRDLPQGSLSGTFGKTPNQVFFGIKPDVALSS